MSKQERKMETVSNNFAWHESIMDKNRSIQKSGGACFPAVPAMWTVLVQKAMIVTNLQLWFILLKAKLFW